MGDINQRLFLTHHLPAVNGPVVEVGSRDYGNTTSFRDVYVGNEYVGVDLEAGKDVDVVADLTQGLGELPADHFALAICCSVLEHTPRPWLMASNITRLLRAGGSLYLSVPWVWRYHAYPDDYYRFSFRAIPVLFDRLTWGQAHYSTNVEGEIFPIDTANPTVDNRLAVFVEIAGRGRRKHLPYLMVNMLGQRGPN